MRIRSSLAISSLPRSTVPHIYHKEVDVILKDLRLSSRRLKSALDSFMAELRTLERLYYKSKNQHRMALFFKRVPEIRRYGRRLMELDILERVDLFRASFVGLEHIADQKTLRSSWTHVPEKPHVEILTERLTACSTLVCKMRERLENAYHHFTLAMQTGAFVQIILLFVAITCRMSTLSSELQEALQQSKSACNRLLAIIQPVDEHDVTDLQPTGVDVTTRQPSLEPETPQPTHTDAMPLEDMGQPVSRCEAIGTPMSVIDERRMEAVLELRVTPLPSQPRNGVDNNGSNDTAKSSKKVAQESQHKKAKKKLDEIDEIFGF